MAAVEPIPRRKLYHEVVSRLLQRIRTGEFPSGAHLPSERQLMESYGVGRPAVREALLTLQRMGLIEISHGERARVLEPTARAVVNQIADLAQHLLATSPQSLEHLKEARVFFEVGMVRIAATKANPTDVARLEAALTEHERSLADLTHFAAKDMIFHRTIASISGNPIYLALSEAMFEWLSKFHVELIRVPGAERLTIDEHRLIFERIADHDPDGAAAAMTSHLMRANKLYAQIAGGRTKPAARG
jgi:GntR family transcriptional regulator, sialic acid-inducible nan operon repressor